MYWLIGLVKYLHLAGIYLEQMAVKTKINKIWDREILFRIQLHNQQQMDTHP